MLYPLKFKSEYFDKIWGGNKHYKILKKDDLPLDKINSIGESWDISCFDACKTKIANGPLMGKTISDLLTEFGSEKILGTNYKEYKSLDFPLLVKVIDASDDLSVQVHPDSEYCKTSASAHSKKESWVILQKEEGSSLIHNFNEGVALSDFFCDLDKNNDPGKYLRKVFPSVGDIIHVNPGTVHAIGKGILLLEIQETSDTTFRVYDYGRPRELHIEQAKKCTKINSDASIQTSYKIIGNLNSKLECFVNEPEYTLAKLTVKSESEYEFDKTTFKIISNIGNKIKISSDGMSIEMNFGDSILIPADVSKIFIQCLETKDSANLIVTWGGQVKL